MGLHLWGTGIIRDTIRLHLRGGGYSGCHRTLFKWMGYTGRHGSPFKERVAIEDTMGHSR